MSANAEDQATEPLLAPSTPSAGLAKVRGTFSLHDDGHGYTYAYGPPGLPGLIRNHYAFACAVFASIGGLTFGTFSRVTLGVESAVSHKRVQVTTRA